jgi:hypothetical protein
MHRNMFKSLLLKRNWAATEIQRQVARYSM